MRVTYDHVAGALYIHLKDNTVISSKRISPDFALDLDENGEVIGVEVLHVRKSGIDPLALEIYHATSDEAVERPDPDAIRSGRIARMDALKRQREKAHKAR